MIVVELMGGLGNQMFQYAAARRLSVFRQTDLYLDLDWFRKLPARTARNYELDSFRLETKSIGGRSDLVSVIRRGRLLKSLQIVREKGFVFDPDVLQAPVNSYMMGYWQSEKYFQDVAHVIRRDFHFERPPGEENAGLLRDIESSSSVSLHVRRGDYVADPLSRRIHVTLGEEYYRRAVELVAEKVRAPHFFMFSDDADWCKRHMQLEYPSTIVDQNPSERGFWDLHLMSRCQHHILANSSFSWWGAWLVPDPTKTVIAPRKWFHDPSIHTEDLLPHDWVKL